jgi:hypothetical protein
MKTVIDTGYFRLSADTELRYNWPAGGSGEIDFEQDTTAGSW